MLNAHEILLIKKKKNMINEELEFDIRRWGQAKNTQTPNIYPLKLFNERKNETNEKKYFLFFFFCIGIPDEFRISNEKSK